MAATALLSTEQCSELLPAVLARAVEVDQPASSEGLSALDLPRSVYGGPLPIFGYPNGGVRRAAVRHHGDVEK
jgi:hypothetical protein